MKAKNFFKSLVCYFVSVAIIISSGLVLPAAAKVVLPDGRDDEFSENNILFYNPNGGDNTEDCPASTGEVIIIGDSITNGSKSEISSKLPGATIIAQDGKQFGGSVSSNPTGIEILKEKKDTLPDTVVMALGTNGNVSKNQIDEALDIIGDERRLILTTNYKLGSPNAYDLNNKNFKDAENAHSNVKVADWYAAVKDDPSKYIHNNDGYAVHPTAEGTKKFAEVIASAVGGTSGGSSSSGDDSGGGNKLYDGRPVLSEDSLNKIKENQPFYEKAANKYGFPWQIIATLHYRENSLSRSNPGNGQGVYQLYSYTNGGKNENAFTPAGPISDDEFQRQTDIVAKLIADRGMDLSSDDGIKTFFFAYNGMASSYKAQARSLGFDEAGANRGEGSPYVMNLADEKRDSKKNSNWKQITCDGCAMTDPANQVPGAFIIYKALGGLSSSCGGNGDVNKTALELAWPYEEKGLHDKYDPRPTYKKALADVGLSTYGEQWVEIGASCDAYVTTVYRYSKVDTDFKCCGASYVLSYLQSSPNYEEVTNSAATLKPGDIRSSPGHVELYVEVDGVGRIASASHADRTAEVGNFYENSGSFKAFRHKGGNSELH